MNAFDTTSVDFLEGLDDEKTLPLSGEQIDSEDYVFGLDDLENLAQPQYVQPTQNVKPVYEHHSVVSSENSLLFDSFLDETDVRLRDVVDKVFRRSDRSFVIIRDDKIFTPKILKVCG